LVLQVLVEKSVLKAGEPIRGESSGRVTAVLVVLAASDLPAREVGKYSWSIVLSYRREFTLGEGSFEIKYPETLPPTLSCRSIKVRWSLVFGTPRLGGRILWPRRELRLKVLPSDSESRLPPSGELELEKLTYQAGEVIRGRFPLKGSAEDYMAGVVVREWLKIDGREYSVEYPLCEGRVLGAGMGAGEVEVKLESDPTKVEDVYFFYPYTFYSSYGGVELGVDAKVRVESLEEALEREIVLKPAEPRLAERVEEEKRGPLLPI